MRVSTSTKEEGRPSTTVQGGEKERKEALRTPLKLTDRDDFFDDFDRFGSLETKSPAVLSPARSEEPRRPTSSRRNARPTRPPTAQDMPSAATRAESEADLPPHSIPLETPPESVAVDLPRTSETTTVSDMNTSAEALSHPPESESAGSDGLKQPSSTVSKTKKKGKRSKKSSGAATSSTIASLPPAVGPDLPPIPKVQDLEHAPETEAYISPADSPVIAASEGDTLLSTSDQLEPSTLTAPSAALEGLRPIDLDTVNGAGFDQSEEPHIAVDPFYAPHPSEQDLLEDSQLYFESSAMEISEYRETPEASFMDDPITPIDCSADVHQIDEEAESRFEEAAQRSLFVGPALESHRSHDVDSSVSETETKEPTLSPSNAVPRSEVDALVKELERKYAALLEDARASNVIAVESLRRELQARESELVNMRANLELNLTQSDNLQKENESLKQQLSSSDSKVSKLNEVVRERERALEVATTQMSELHAQSDTIRRRVSDLQAEIEAKDAKLAILQSASVGETEMRRRMEVLMEENLEKSQRLVAFEEEGRALALKQGEMEKSFRRMAKEIKDKDAEIAKLSEVKASQLKTIEQLQTDIKRHETESSNVSKSLSAMQAISSSSNERIQRMEAELSTKTEEVLSLKKALDTAWTENGDLKRLLAEAQAERDEVRARVEEELGKIKGAEDLRRQYEQREAVLRATSKQMQDSLQRQMEEASAREARLHAEVNEMRRRWQDAVSSREIMTEQIGDATAPLLRQIASTQESLRIKTEQWQAVESALNERVIRAETLAEKSEHRRRVMEEQLESYKESLQSTKQKLSEVQLALQRSEEVSAGFSQQERRLVDRVKDLEEKLGLETSSRQLLLNQIRDLETSNALELQELKERLVANTREYESTIAQLKKELSAVHDRESIDRQEGNNRKSRRGNADRFEPYAISSSGTLLSTCAILIDYFNDLGNVPQGLVAESEKLRQRMQHQEERNLEATMQLQQLQVGKPSDFLINISFSFPLKAARDALLQEVGILNSKNAELEDRLEGLRTLKEDLVLKTTQNNVLLTLLGEKEEELELLHSDLEEVKVMYKKEIAELMSKVVPDDNTFTEVRF